MPVALVADAHLEQTIAQSKPLFTQPSFGGNGKTIPSLNNAAVIFPRYSARRHVKLNALVSCLTSLSQGKPIDMGGKPK